MDKLPALLFPSEPTTVYLTVRSVLVMAVCLFFLTQAVNVWIASVLQPPPGALILDRTGPSSTGSGPDATGPSTRSAADLQTIIDRNIFGGSPVAPAEDEKKDDLELEKIPLAENLKQYRLIGTIISSDGADSAIIENTKTKKQDVMIQGDRIQNARIKKILRNNVIVNDGSQDQVLSIDYKIRSRIQESTTSAPGDTRSGGPTQRVTLDRAKVQNALTDFNDLLQQARIRPYLEQGQSTGMQITNITKGSFFDSLHLKNGDVLVGTESSDLNSPQGLLDLVQEIQSTDVLELQIKRGGKDMAIRYRLQ